jgi:hypothetical protein
MTTSARNPPAPRTAWTHRKGARYIVEAVINEHATKPSFVPTVVYRGTDGVLWGRPLSEWHDSFEPAPASETDLPPSLPKVKEAAADLIKRLNITGSMIALGERISWGSDTAIMTEAALKIAALVKALDAATSSLSPVPKGCTIIRLAKVPPAPVDATQEWVCCGAYTPCRGQCTVLAPREA